MHPLNKVIAALKKTSVRATMVVNEYSIPKDRVVDADYVAGEVYSELATQIEDLGFNPHDLDVEVVNEHYPDDPFDENEFMGHLLVSYTTSGTNEEESVLVEKAMAFTADMYGLTQI